MELKLLSILVILFLFVSSFSAKNEYRNPATTASSFSSGNPIAILNTGWILDKTIENVECYHMLMDCDGHKAVLLKFNNRNAYKVKITWKEVFDSQSEKAVVGYLGQKELVLSPGETAQNDCTVGKMTQCITRGSQVNPTYLAEIKQFSFKDIIVSTVGK